MWVRGVPYDEFARLRRRAPVASYVNGAVIPVDGPASAGGRRHLPFDPGSTSARYDGSAMTAWL
jgi:hypothetical protein